MIKFFTLPFASHIVSLIEPDRPLLDAAVFHATNRVGREHELPLFMHDVCLYKAAKNHAASMALKGYNSFNDSFSPFEKTDVVPFWFTLLRVSK